jgi:hypothetical protein
MTWIAAIENDLIKGIDRDVQARRFKGETITRQTPMDRQLRKCPFFLFFVRKVMLFGCSD